MTVSWSEVDEFYKNWDNSRGRKPGCLPRATKPGVCCSFFRDKFTVIPRKDWPDVLANPNRVRLRPSVPVILDQNGYGSCATESASQCVMTCRGFSGQPFVLLNPWFVYQTTSGGRDGGSNIDTNLSFIRENGIAPESIWPRSKGIRTKPSAEAYEAAKEFKILEFYDITSIEEFGTALFLGFSISYGRKGHSIMGTEVLTAKTFLYANSWGDWGDAGFGIDSFDDINFGYGAFAVRTVTDSGVSPMPRLSEFAQLRFEPYPVIAT
jgi:hypothetical protein